MNNLEIKARYPNDRALRLVQSLDITEYYEFNQTDVYFNVPENRLKLRSINDESAELIYYARPDRPEAKNSYYEIYQTKDPAQLQKLLTLIFGIKNTVIKTRKVYIYKDCRIHIDNVQGLGEFLEFEVVIIHGRTAEEAQKLMQYLTEHFNITAADLVNISYTDLRN
jgi:adenylate cyclase